MNKAIDRDLSEHEHLVDPPIIDFLAYESELQAYVAEFIPEEKVSSQRKECVYLRDGTATARRVRELLEELRLRLMAPAPITRIAHAGGGDFDFDLADNQSVALHEADALSGAIDIYAVLQVLSQEVQLEFIMQRYARDRAVG
jgi:hypothetical protein